ncbi:MAG TPA: HAMP domain-containing sensor histidine kinase [Verrucomicrobiae bacterium]|nr:HAMP domain-containing sensor histidine kinase [Verrucomicrobiae bacterium]
MKDQALRLKHKALNTLIQDSICRSVSGKDANWKHVKALFKKGCGVGHYVAEVFPAKKKIEFKICIYHFDKIDPPSSIWRDKYCLRRLHTPRPLRGRVMRYFKNFPSSNDTFYHREIVKPGKIKIADLKAEILNAPRDSEKLFTILDKADLTILPPKTAWLFICPLPVLASPSTFLFFESKKEKRGRHEKSELRLAKHLAEHFQTMLSNSAMKFLLEGITRDIVKVKIKNIEELQHAFICNIAAIFLPMRIEKNGREFAMATELHADPSEFKIKIKMGDQVFKFIPAALPSCSLPAKNAPPNTNVRIDHAMADRYKFLGDLLSALYEQLKTCFLATFEQGKHEGVKILLVSLQHDLIGRISQRLYSDLDSLDPNKCTAKDFEIWKSFLRYQNVAFKHLRLLAKDENKLPSVEPKSIPLKKTVDDCIQLVNWLESGKPICHNRIPENMNVFADAGVIAQIVVNFLTNARKNTPHERSDLPIVIDAIKTRKNHMPGILIRVKDAGCRVNRKIKNHLFKRYGIHMDPPGKRTEGAGFGLFLCAKSARAHGGITIHGQNQPHGSIFGCFFPNPKLKGA